MNQINKSDHDLLIEMKATFDAFMTRYDTDILQLKDGYTSKINDHEIRLKIIEKVFDQTDPVNTYKEYQRTRQEFHDWKNTANTIRIVAGFAGGAILWLLLQVPNLLKFLGITQ